MQTGTTHPGTGSTSGPGQFPTSDGMSKSSESLSRGAERMSDKAHEAVDCMSDRVQPTVDALSEKASHAVEAVSHRAEQLRTMQDTALETTRTYVRENPIAAIGIAAVAGLLLGRMRH